MATRIKEWMIPYTWWDGIEITDNHVINVLLRAANNLIHVNEDRELYVDLQLPAGIAPDDDFPVGVTTGEILAEDWWQQSGTIINSKTTSWDYVRLIYANDWNLYYDPWTWVRIMIGTATAIDVNTKTFFLNGATWATNIATAQQIVDYFYAWKMPIVYNSTTNATYYYYSDAPTQMHFIAPQIKRWDRLNKWHSYTVQSCFHIEFNSSTHEVSSMWFDDINTSEPFLAVWVNYTNPYTPSYAGSPATKKYVDDGLATKQNTLTAGSWIVIDSNTNTISANIQWALVYKWNVADVASLPSSWNTVWDVYYVESDGVMYAWDGTAWKAVGNTQIDLSNYFNVTTNTTDDITQGSTNLFVTQAMIDAWNWKQWALTAGTNIQINNWVISATDTTYSAGTGIWITWTTINNTAPFSPENAGSVWQVLKRTSTGVRWSNEFFENVFVTQAEYDALPSSKLTDWKTYFIYS